MAKRSNLPLVLGLILCAGGCIAAIAGLAQMGAELLPDAMRPGFWTVAVGVALFVAGLTNTAVVIILGIIRRKSEQSDPETQTRDTAPE